MTLKPSRLNSIGQTYLDFKVIKAIEIPELQCYLRELIHVPTGAQVMHLSNDDPENMFCLSFKTLPDDSKGVAHILEHTVLCGSEKYPVKDPFFSMSRRSLNTFMNALTGSDFTCYPAASQVEKDFYNLLEVYIDAVFHPNLNELSFLQEGHRLEFSSPNDPHSHLEHKGIVFNEMKGALSSAGARLGEAINEALFPDLTYGKNSGGDPKEIPKLSYSELCAFHETFYQPSRCLFFFYGNMPLEKHLDYISKHVLHGAKQLAPLPPLPLQPRFKQPKFLTLHYPIPLEEDTNDKTLISFSWLTCHILNQEEVLALSIIEIILMDTDASPLKLALLKSGLCKQASIYMDTDINEIPVTIVLRGCNPEDADKLEAILRQTLNDIVAQGIPLELIENALHQEEFFRSEITGNHSPFGLSLFMRSALLKQHSGNPENGLMIHSLFEELHRKHFEDPHYLTNLIKKYFLDNTHFVRICMVPDKELAAQEIVHEKEELKKIQNELSPSQIKQLIQKSKDLVEFQKKQEEVDLEVLPKITLDDVPKSSRTFHLNRDQVGPLEVFHHNCFTNGIIYSDLIFDLPEIPEADLPLFRLFTILLPQIGCGGRKYTETLQYIQAHTGGIGAFFAMHLQTNDFRSFHPSLYIRGKALHRKANKLFSLMYDMVTSLDFKDLDRLKEIILKHYTSLHSSLTQNALKYAMNLSASDIDIASKVSNAWHGLEYYWAIKAIAENIDEELVPLTAKLKKIQQQLLCLENPHLVITCNGEMYDELKSHHFYGLENIPTHPFIPWSGRYAIKPVPDQGRIIASPIAFIAQAFKTVPYIHPDAPSMLVAAALFENLTLHTRIREQGGAYGGGASSNPLSGNFWFYSYRDPNINKSLHAFKEAVDSIVDGDFDDSDLEEAKLEVIQTLDAPVAPGSRGDLAYSWLREGKTQEIRQAFRNRLLSLSKKDIIEAVESHIAKQSITATTVVFAGKELLEKENALLKEEHKKPLIIDNV